MLSVATHLECDGHHRKEKSLAGPGSQENAGRELHLDRPLFDYLSVPLWLRCGLRLLRGGGMGMIRNGFHDGFIHRLRARFRERPAGGNDPVFGAHGSGAAGAALDPARIDAQLGFAAGEIGLRIDGAFSRQIRTLLGGFGITDDDQFVICVLLQVLGNVVQFAFALVVYAPRLLDLSHVLEAAFRQLAGLRRWRWWRIFNRDLRGGRRIQAARIRTSRVHRNRTGRCTRGIEGRGVAAP